MTQILELLDMGLKIIMINMFKKIDGYMENFIIEPESVKNNHMGILELKILISDIKKLMDGFNGKLMLKGAQ